MTNLSSKNLRPDLLSIGTYSAYTDKTEILEEYTYIDLLIKHSSLNLLHVLRTTLKRIVGIKTVDLTGKVPITFFHSAIGTFLTLTRFFIMTYLVYKNYYLSKAVMLFFASTTLVAIKAVF